MVKGSAVGHQMGTGVPTSAGNLVTLLYLYVIKDGGCPAAEKHVCLPRGSVERT